MRHLKFMLLAIAVVSCSAPAPKTGEKLPQNPKEQFRGRWSLHAIERQQPDGSFTIPDHYQGRTGFILYDGLGGMGVQHVPAGYADYPVERGTRPDSMSQKDLAYLMNQLVYFGRYSLDTSQQLITHHIETDIRPYMWGEPVQRRYEFRGDTLYLMPVTADPPLRISWIKVNDQ